MPKQISRMKCPATDSKLLVFRRVRISMVQQPFQRLIERAFAWQAVSTQILHWTKRIEKQAAQSAAIQ
jgi:hypothetical protein